MWVHVLASGEVALPAIYITETAIDLVVQTPAGEIKVEVPDAEYGNEIWGEVEPGFWYRAAGMPRFSIVPLESLRLAPFQKTQLSELARQFEESMGLHWPAREVGTATPFDTAFTAAQNARLNNSYNWGRSLIGMAWMEVLRNAGDTGALALVLGDSAVLTAGQVEGMIILAEDEIRYSPYLAEWWYEFHNSALWTVSFTERRIQRTSKQDPIEGHPAAIWDRVSNTLPQATWDAIVLTYYRNALRVGIGLPELLLA